MLHSAAFVPKGGHSPKTDPVMLSLRTRLLGLALAPAAVAVALAGMTTMDGLQSAAAATEVAHDVDVVVDLVTAESSLAAAVIPLEVETHIGETGVLDMLPDGLVQALLPTGTSDDDPAERFARTLARLPRALRPVEVGGVEQLLSNNSHADGVVAPEIERVTDKLQQSIDTRIDTLRSDIVGLGQSELTKTLLRLDLAARAYDASGDRLARFAEVILSGVRGGGVALGQVAALARDDARFDTAMQELAVHASDATMEVPRYDRGIDEVLQGGQPQEIQDDGLLGAAGMFQEGLGQHTVLEQEVASASQALRTAATDLAGDATRAGIAAAGLILMMLLLMGLGVYLLARTVEQPLSALIARTHRVGAGDLDDEPLQPEGPREIAAATQAFNDVVDNLRLLEAKVRALASCQFEDPVLAERLPGPLGEELTKSVSVLSGSIHDRTELQDRLAHEATHDPLTGLPNRAAAIEALTAYLSRARRTGRVAALAFVDLDGFKRANDTYGHAHGDEVLRQVAARLQAASREADFVARLGGDEFVVVFDDVEDLHTTVGASSRLAERIAQPIEFEGRTLHVGASIGLAFAQDGEGNAHDLLAKADLAVYRAKNSEQDVALFDESLQAELRHRTEVENALRAELAAGGPGLELHYQPIVRTADRSVRGFEALLRWRRADGNVVPPGDFIPVAEGSQLVVDLDRWVLDTGLQQLATWHAHPDLRHLQLAVNVSGRHVLSHDFADHVREALARVDIAPSSLTIEVTETVLLDDLVAAADNLGKVREFGVRVAVDDFGTGYTSLAHLRQLPMDELKIDRSFVSHLSDARDRDLVRTIHDLARHVGIPTIAEGIETDDQFTFLREIGCDNVQGFFFGRPTPAAELGMDLLRAPLAG